MVVGGDLGDDPVVIGGAETTTGKSPIRVTNLQPNPTNDWSLLGFTVTENMRLRGHGLHGRHLVEQLMVNAART